MWTVQITDYRKCTLPYLCNLVTDYLPRHALRSADQMILDVQRTRTITAERAFSVAGPARLNDLPLRLRQSTNLDKFKTELKTNLFVKIKC